MIKIIEPSIKLLTPEIHIAGMAERIKYPGCVCYQSYETTSKTADEFIAMLVGNDHLSVLEHESISVSIICDRGVSHELVRHRLAAYSQESTRYCNYASKSMEFIKPCWFEPDWKPKKASDIDSYDIESISASDLWFLTMNALSETYNTLIEKGYTPQQARSVLPNSLKTEIVMTANLREWLHVFKLRTAPDAHPQMRQVMEMVKTEFKRLLPGIFI